MSRAMYRLRKPTRDRIARYARARRDWPVFDDCGPRPATIPSGFFPNVGRGRVGSGPAAFQAAREAMRQWEMFPNWAQVDLDPDGSPPIAGCTVAVTARCLGVWATNCCRVMEVIDEPGTFAFTYATVAGHAVTGSEEFAVRMHPSSGDVVYEVCSIARPHDLVVWAVFPVFRRIQKRFAVDSPLALKRAVERRLAPAESLSGGGSPTAGNFTAARGDSCALPDVHS